MALAKGCCPPDQSGDLHSGSRSVQYPADGASLRRAGVRPGHRSGVGCLFGGLVLGTFINARLIIRVGHIRAYAAYASLLCFLFLLHGMVGGACHLGGAAADRGFATGGTIRGAGVLDAGLKHPGNRGRLMSLTMILLYGSLALGQLLLKQVDPVSADAVRPVRHGGDSPVVPLALSRVATPAVVAPQPVGVLELVRLTPAGMGSSFTSGLILPGPSMGCCRSISPTSMAPPLPGGGHDGAGDPGGMCLQYLSDVHPHRYDRRLVILLLCALPTLIALWMVLLPEPWREASQGTLVFLLGHGVLHLSQRPQPCLR